MILSERRIGVTLGDPAGVGPEVVAAALDSLELPEGISVDVIGTVAGHTAGQATEASARAALEAMEESARRLLAGEIQAVVTGPVCKHALHRVGFEFPGQTEFFSARAGVENFAMCLTGGALTVALVTAHVPLTRVAPLLSVEEIVRVGRLLQDFLIRRGKKNPRIAVAGLNPHAGEQGDMGREEIDIIAPAVACLSQIGNFVGPLPPDTLFYRAVEGDFDGVLCMYHDQGLIPLKLHAFHEGVNVTLGLPFIRTSPDHGTAFDIAGRGVADHANMVGAMLKAVELSRSRVKAAP
jgi:4-hydroxythreonine-4-phosphate dehydrogenase